jgi:DNA-binding HxlR family transcriptional regulator
MKNGSGKAVRFESKSEIRTRAPHFACPVELVISEIGGKWKASILFNLRQGPTRFSELKRRLQKITPRMLARQLRELEKSGYIYRDVFPEVPPRVEYGLSPHGKSLNLVMNSMAKWGKDNGWSSGV